MKRLEHITLKNVQDVYSGPEGILWELIMGEQIHVGGFKSSMALATAAGIQEGWYGIDLCSALGAGCRFLVKNFKVRMVGQDATPNMLRKARERCSAEGFDKLIEFREGDLSKSIIAENSIFDFAWGEDTWCYLVNKEKLISEIARVLKPGGTVAFTDWIEGPVGLSDAEAERINTFMKFPYMENRKGYEILLEKYGFNIVESTDLTEEFADYVDFYIKMLTDQFTFDGLKIIGDDMELFTMLGGEMAYMAEKSHVGKMGRGRFVAKKA